MKRIESDGNLDIPDFEVTRSKHPVHLRSKYHALIDGTNGDVTLEHVDTYFLKTHVSAKGKVAGTTGEHGKTASLDFHATQGRVQDLFRLVVHEPKPPFNGIINFRAHAVLPPGHAPFLEKVRLSGDFGISGGEFAKSATQESIDEFSERARGQKPDDDSDDKDRVISDLAGHVELLHATATPESAVP